MSRPVHGGNLAWAAGLARCAPDELLDFSASISPLGPPYSIREAIQAAFSWVSAYPDTEYGALRAAIAQHHQIPIEYVLPGNGAAELLTWAARDLAERSHICFQATPNFSDYDRALKAFHCALETIPLVKVKRWQSDNWNLDNWDLDNWDKDFLQVAQTSSPLHDCGLLLNNPHNPTGALLSRERVRSLLAEFGWVVVDEAFMDFLPPEREQSVIAWVREFPNLVVLRSLTKFYSMPGLRLGYAVAAPETLQRWQQWRDPWSVNVLAAAAGVAAIQDRAFQQQTWDWLAETNAAMYDGLARLPGLRPLPSCANFFLVACEGSVTKLQERLLKEYKIYIRDCMSFELLGDRYFRVAVKTAAENQRLLNALADLLPSLTRI